MLFRSGRFSVFPKAASSSVTPQQMNMEVEEPGIAHALILDRKIIGDNLILSGWDKKKLQQELKQRNLTVEEVFLFSVNDAGETTIIIKEQKK